MIENWENLKTHLKYRQARSKKCDHDRAYFNQYEIIKNAKQDDH